MKYIETYKLFESKEDDYKDYFIKEFHIYELEIKFDFIEYVQNIHYFYEKFWMMSQNKKAKKFYFRYSIWETFVEIFNFSHINRENDTKNVINSILTNLGFDPKYKSDKISSGLHIRIQRKFKKF